MYLDNITESPDNTFVSPVNIIVSPDNIDNIISSLELILYRVKCYINPRWWILDTFSVRTPEQNYPYYIFTWYSCISDNIIVSPDSREKVQFYQSFITKTPLPLPQLEFQVLTWSTQSLELTKKREGGKGNKNWQQF